MGAKDSRQSSDLRNSSWSPAKTSAAGRWCFPKRRSTHWGKPSFRVRKRIFATLWLDEEQAVLKLPLDEQDALTGMDPETYTTTAWGHQGWTRVELGTVDREAFREHLMLAWRQVAPRRAIRAYESRA